MSNVPHDLQYTAAHEWIRREGNVLTIGITDFAQAQLCDVVFVELPDEGSEVMVGDSIAVVESVKAASDVYAPATGTIVEINEALIDSPELVNEDPYEDAWFFKIALTEEEETETFMDAESYQDQCSE